jgi:hypothetical protein
LNIADYSLPFIRFFFWPGPKDVPGVLEHFVLTDPMGNVWHFGVEAQGLKDLQKYASEVSQLTAFCTNACSQFKFSLFLSNGDALS